MIGNLLERSKQVWNGLLGRPAGPPLVNVRTLGATPAPLASNRQYWQLRIGELFLHDPVGWRNTYDPLVVVISEFDYDGARHAVPKLVGPGLLGKMDVASEPLGMIYKDTRVAGLHPYLGGRLNVSLVLCRAKRSDVARALIPVLESAGAALDVAAEIAPYLRIGSVLLDGVDRLRGSQDVESLCGHRRELDPDAGDHVGPLELIVAGAPDGGHVALEGGKIVAAHRGHRVDATRLMSAADQLCYLWDDGLCYPYRASSFVVAELLASDARGDLTLLPCWPLWQQVRHDAASGTATGLEMARTGMKALYQHLLRSPDFTPDHARRQVLAWKAEMEAVHATAVAVAERPTFESTAGDERAAEQARDAALQREALDLFAK